MERALAQARLAKAMGEVPVGAVIYGPDGALLAEACNAPISLNDPTAPRRDSGPAPGRRQARQLSPHGLRPRGHPGAMPDVRGGHDPRPGVRGGLWGVRSQVRGRCLAPGRGVARLREPPPASARAAVLADQCSALLREFFRDRR